jgi:hypothetical protein
VRPIKPTTANGAFKVGTGGAAGNRSAADIEAIKKAAFEKGVRDYHDKRVRDGHHAALQRNEDWVADRINSRSVDDAGMRALLGGA